MPWEDPRRSGFSPGPGRRSGNLRERTVLPGFCDTHMHLLAYGFSREQVDLKTAAVPWRSWSVAGRTISG